jgi:hypothetical protein
VVRVVVVGEESEADGWAVRQAGSPERRRGREREIEKGALAFSSEGWGLGFRVSGFPVKMGRKGTLKRERSSFRVSTPV